AGKIGSAANVVLEVYFPHRERNRSTTPPLPPAPSPNLQIVMPKGEKKKSAKNKEPEVRLVAENRKARFRFEILDTLECGIQLTGSEVKSLRDGKLSLEEAYARVKDGEVWLVGADIAEYPQATLWNHTPKRPRKLLLRREECDKFANKAHEKGLTLVPLR